MNIPIVIFSLMVAIGAYFVAKGLFGAAGFCGVIVMPITRAVANDYRMNILSEARHAVVDAISGTKQQVDAIIREVVAPLENPDQQTGLLELRRHAEQHNLKLEGFHSAVDRYDRFLEQNPDLVE